MTAPVIEHAFIEQLQFMLDESPFACADNYIKHSPILHVYFMRHPYLLKHCKVRRTGSGAGGVCGQLDELWQPQFRWQSTAKSTVR